MKETLKEKLEKHYVAFDKSSIEPDPLQFLHLYKNENDIELVGFIASVFAYGNVRQIISTMNRITGILGNDPVYYLKNSSKKIIEKDFSNIVHRFYSSADIAALFILLKDIYVKEGSLRHVFVKNYDKKSVNLKNEISLFTDYIFNGLEKQGASISHGLKFMFPNPAKGSACKRMNLFLRWMVRKDELDFGLWDDIDKSKLIIPVDTHVARVCKEIKLTKRKIADWKMAEEITENLKKLDPDDPVKYDFAICHIGMRKMKL